MLTDSDKKWLSEHLVTKDYLAGSLAQVRSDLMDEMARVYRDLNRRIETSRAM